MLIVLEYLLYVSKSFNSVQLMSYAAETDCGDLFRMVGLLRDTLGELVFEKVNCQSPLTEIFTL